MLSDFAAQQRQAWEYEAMSSTSASAGDTRSAPDNLADNPLDETKRDEPTGTPREPHDPGDNLITNPLDKPGAADNLIDNPLDKR
jgi:hypothetical protein